jgi:hypothetical protein
MSSTPTIFPANRLAPLRGIRCRELLRLHRPQNAQHLVQFYEDESFIIDTISFLAAQTLVSGDSSVIVATEPRLNRIGERIATCGLNLNVLQTLGRYVAVEATEALAQFMIGAQPDEKKFDELIGGILRGAESNSEHGFVFVFGEMVELLCGAKKPAAAVHLEKFWNALAARHHFSLYCAYWVMCLMPTH